MTIEEMQQKKRELGLTIEQISSLSGVPQGTVMKIFRGATKSPRRGTILALEKVFLAQQQSSDVPESYISHKSAMPKLLRDGGFSSYGINRQDRNYTVEDYEKLPDDKRYELIDGKLYDLAAPSTVHQTILLEMAMQLRNCAMNHAADCLVMIAPYDVQLDRDNQTIVQPDIMVLCDREKLTDSRCFGAPDLIVEILSFSSRSIDCVLKLNKYRNAGVREYWIVDPEHKKVIVYDFEHGDKYSFYEFTDLIPVGISEGRCHIDFSRIDAYIKTVSR